MSGGERKPSDVATREEPGRARMGIFEPATEWDPHFLEGTEALEGIAEAAALFRDLTEWPTVETIDARLRDRVPVRFVEQAPKAKRRRRRAPVDADTLYDGRITLEGVVPTRARCWHDFMNALVWASFPSSKRALHARQYAAARARIGAPRTRLPGTRTVEEDALTMLDEGGELVFVAGGAHAARVSPAEVDASEATQRYVFGHALLEHVVAGAPSARAKRLCLSLGAALPDDAGARRALCDATLAAYLRAGHSLR